MRSSSLSGVDRLVPPVVWLAACLSVSAVNGSKAHRVTDTTRQTERVYAISRQEITPYRSPSELSEHGRPVTSSNPIPVPATERLAYPSSQISTGYQTRHDRIIMISDTAWVVFAEAAAS